MSMRSGLGSGRVSVVFEIHRAATLIGFVGILSLGRTPGVFTRKCPRDARSVPVTVIYHLIMT